MKKKQFFDVSDLVTMNQLPKKWKTSNKNCVYEQ